MDTHGSSHQCPESVPSYYHEMTLPCIWDEGILCRMNCLPGLSECERHRFITGINTESAGTLKVFAGRMAMLSVRKKDPGMLIAGLASMGLALLPADMEGQRMALCELTQLHTSAKKLGLDPAEVFKKAVAMGGKESAGILAFLDREPRNRSIECMGYYEVEGPSGLIYWSGDCPVAEGLLYDRPMIPDALREFWNQNDISLFYRGLFETGKPILSRLTGPERDRIEGLYREAFRAGSRDSRVILGLGWLHSEEAEPDLQALMISSASPEQARADAAVALRDIAADRRSHGTLLSILAASSSSYTRQAVVTALREFPAGETETVLKNALLDRDKSVRTEAVYSLMALHGILADGLDWPRFMSDLMLGKPEAVVEIERQMAGK
ncbi:MULTISPECIES: HEAT repeat domain-containing protein [unclassified Methanoregula]|uniref:HEAT repeat domain-containing protein n=1 Tax=unclassified Methanoregula TaxID=2649730 RepID=UPI0009C50FE5|nr:MULTISPECIES: hypothetical protein [unclassified Methanoregula]OPX62879.1 MAG: hypothetical protein A4E33_02008 [Methanoregula sp. PtaB.Bin085]OPY35316.1 MAG: hypothetical protein A4E34_00844 [Methanoregula sp. PtaU1.Bin006]